MAKRDKLTQRQKRQVLKQQKQRIKNNQSAPVLDNLSSPYDGLLISRYGEQADVLRLDNQQKYRCYLRQNLGSLVTGDKVSFRLSNEGQGIVEAKHDRDSLLQRPSVHQGLKPVVANINQVFVVVAPLPDFSATLLDRYLVAIKDADINTVIVANKWDLQTEIEKQSIAEQLNIYQQLGYPVIHLSTKSGEGVSNLKNRAIEKQSILVGQSGVGKSSIINQLFPEQTSLVNSVSDNSRLGQHTTTASQLFLFENNQGFIVDSPGIRDFGLWHMNYHSVAEGFIEFLPYIGSCKFRDCKHINEPGCEIIKAVKAEKINHQRWNNYCKIVLSPQE
ncbi:small ribosomal subunit biogenesis GTPase RsgA [Aliikangiella sp. IMCC44359]|uniref:small ribosomal subunit biogenesis GTPase RsgA n=1 Tax=Aliikangiella sp. IMCC44359 TaxID=3459125 RepID=UPI00403AA306